MIVKTRNGQFFSLDEYDPTETAKFLLFVVPKLHAQGDVIEVGQMPRLKITPEVEGLLAISNRIKANKYEKNKAGEAFPDDIPF